MTKRSFCPSGARFQPIRLKTCVTWKAWGIRLTIDMVGLPVDLFGVFQVDTALVDVSSHVEQISHRQRGDNGCVGLSCCRSTGAL